MSLPRNSAAGTYAFTVVATDGAGAAGSGTYSLTVEPPPTPVALTPPDLPTGLVGTFYLQPITASGPPGSFFTFAVGSGSLPPGLTLAMSDSQSAMLIGTPAAAGSFDFTVTATDGVSEVGTQPYTLTVYPAAGGGGGGGGGGSGGPGPMLIVSGSPDGSAVVTAAEQGKTQLAGNAVTWVTARTAVQEYSASTGRLLRTFGIAKNRPAVFRCGILWSDPAGGVVIGLTTGGRVAVITGSRIVPLNRPPSVLAGHADAGTW